MKRTEFINCGESSPYWNELEKLFQSEWNNFHFRDSYKSGVELPPVIVALDDDKVVGGLAYSLYQEPHQQDEVVWINAVFVCPQWRGKGIATELIRRGVYQVSATAQDYLYVYTNVAPLYLSLGWGVVDIESEPDHSVMSISL